MIKLSIIFICLFGFSNCSAQLTSIDKFDIDVLTKIGDHRTPAQTDFFRAISNANNYINIAVPAALLVAGIAENNTAMKQNALYVASSAATTALLNMVLKQVFKRPRPFTAHVNFNPVYRPSGFSLPSGHTSLAFSTASALSLAYPKWYVIAPSLLWAGTVGYSRMYLGVHNPSDVTAGALLGTGVSLGMGFIKH